MDPIPAASGAGQPDRGPNLLDELKAQLVWLLWRSEPNPDPTKKPIKVPYYVGGGRRNGQLDGPEDRSRLVTHAVAEAKFEELAGAYTGLAIALGPDGRGGCWQGIDLDDIEAKGLSDLATQWVRGDSAGWGYIEITPSGEGAHVLGYGQEFRTLGSNASGIEAYSGERFFTFTGVSAKHDSPHRPIDLAPYVEKVLAPRHSCGRSKAQSESATTSVDPKTVTELRSALAHMRSDDRDMWMRMGMALKDLGEIGRGLWFEWSQTSESYEPRQASRDWDSFEPRDTGYKAVFAEAQRQGWVNPASKEAALVPSAAAPDNGRRELVCRPLGGVQPRAIDWLWTGWIPQGYITILAGESGAGKSTVLADIAARVTTGRPWPGERLDALRVPGRVLWLGSEDSVEEMTVPRLMACGAALDNVTAIDGVALAGKRTTFSMQDDLEEVSRLLGAAKVEQRPFAMLVIDPVTSYLPGQKLRKVDLNDSGQMRTILEPWLALAQQHNIAIVCVTHFAKDTSRQMMHRVLGSGAFVATCRSLCVVIERQATEDFEPEPNEKLMLQVKTNLPEDPGGSWRLVTEKVEVSTDPRNSKPIAATRPSWLELDATLSARTVVGPKRGPKSQKAEGFGIWVRAQFAQNPPEWLPVSVVLAAAKKVGVSDSWWNKNSSDFLDRDNQGGTWMCRPKSLH
ncbi:AAA family ATPase [Sphingomonas sp. BN140010]|uniref:AAA family ATPase n=1 Tax=Sphingomonas arvum TaxID=2992113 RepID=A0ABT3JE76_9SPHN|nr:AAA family ATPase [Sphingomonas sp. BN140010]MCW3797372.1 AAA family ATPase [Sphingomonas sp. BN140010]